MNSSSPTRSARLSRKQFLGSLAAATCAAAVGCVKPAEKASPTAAPPKSSPLRLLVIDDPDLGKTIAREWLARTESEIEVQTAQAQELQNARRLPGDVVIFASALLGEFAERDLIVPLQEELLSADDFNRQDIFENIRRHEMNWGRKPFAVPLGSPQLLLLYREDMLKRLEIEPPATWADYQAAVERLALQESRDVLVPRDARWLPTVEPLAPGWAGQLLLARAASYALHRDQVSPLFEYQSLEPLIAEPPYVRALEELVAAYKAGMSWNTPATPAEAYAGLLAGRHAMALTWPHKLEGENSPEAGHIRCAPLPGSRDVYNFGTTAWENMDELVPASLLGVSGRLGAITASAAQPRAAQGFLQWLASSEISNRVGPRSQATTLFRTSQIPAASQWATFGGPAAAASYAEVLKSAQSQARWMWSLRLPERAKYLSALDSAVSSALAGAKGELIKRPEREPADALQRAADAWRGITKGIGVIRQRQANQRSLGMETFQ